MFSRSLLKPKLENKTCALVAILSADSAQQCILHTKAERLFQGWFVDFYLEP